MQVTVTKNGPYLVSGGVPLTLVEFIVDEKGHPIDYKHVKKIDAPESYALCRCGGSKNKPFCDGTHLKNGFDGTTVATHESYVSKCAQYPGHGITLYDDKTLCADAGFCAHGLNAWIYTKESINPQNKANAIKEACACPSGRLVMMDENNNPIETKYKQEIFVLEDPHDGCSCAYMIVGGIPVIDEEGNTYEVRNRQTVCRCGHSKNKPFCDGTHYSISFQDQIVKPDAQAPAAAAK